MGMHDRANRRIKYNATYVAPGPLAFVVEFLVVPVAANRRLAIDFERLDGFFVLTSMHLGNGSRRASSQSQSRAAEVARRKMLCKVVDYIRGRTSGDSRVAGRCEVSECKRC